MSLIYLTKRKLKELILNQKLLINSLSKIPEKDIKKLYENYQNKKNIIIKLSQNNNLNKIKEKIYSFLPELEVINKKIIYKGYDYTILLTLFDKINNKKIFTDYKKEKNEYKQLQLKRKNYGQYLIYLIQRKIGLINHSVPGAEQIEKELGIKPFKE